MPIIARDPLWYYVTVYGSNSLSKYALREEGYLLLIKCTDQVNLVEVGHFNNLFIFLLLYPSY
jgi:hypothetical protein